MKDLVAETPSGLSDSIPIVGMTCASCVGRVEKAVAKVPGVAQVAVNLATETAEVRYGGPMVRDAVIAAIRATGYDVSATTVEIGIEGMTCASCVSRVERALAAVPGVLSASVNLATERATLRVEGASGAAMGRIEAAIRNAGYEARALAAGVESKAAQREEEQARLKRDLIFAGALTLPIFVLEMGGHASPALHHWGLMPESAK